jgi:hypothetical protein
MCIAAEQQQVLADGALYLGIAGQRAARVHSQAFGSLDLCDPIVANTVVHDNACRLLCEHAPLPIITD